MGWKKKSRFSDFADFGPPKKPIASEIGSYQHFAHLVDFPPVGVGLLNIVFSPADPPKVDETCPTQHFLESWASGEYF